MDVVDLAWAAGLFEGEGTVRINTATKRNLGHLIVSVVNTDRSTVEFFQDRWPGTLRGATGLNPLKQRPAWVWTVAARKAAAFLTDIQPYLRSERVRRKAALGLEFQAQKARTNWVSDEYRETQWLFFMEMKELNLRGVQR